MLSVQDNERLARVGRGTPGGELMRRYWHPIAVTTQLDDNPVQAVRILGEDLTLYKDRGGRIGLIAERCAHRAMALRFAVPEEKGLRCPYHGWLYDETGQCIETPLEPPDSTLKDRIKIEAHPVEEMGGLIWGYLGPEPAPLLPRWDLFVREDGFRQIAGHRLPCNWLQVMENRGDLRHNTYLHGRLFQYVLERQGRATDDPNRRFNADMAAHRDRLARGVYERFRAIPNEYGFRKGFLDSDKSEESGSWQVGMNPILFPYILHSGTSDRVRQVYQIGVPIDDTHTWHISYHCFVFPPHVQVPEQTEVPYVEVPIKDENGEYILDYVLGQDMVAWWGQGELTDRSAEHLAVSDTCVIAYRQLLSDQIEAVRDGGEPMNVFTDPVKNEHLMPPVPSSADLAVGGPNVRQFYRANYHKKGGGGWSYMDDDVDRYFPDKTTIQELFEQISGADS